MLTTHGSLNSNSQWQALAQESLLGCKVAVAECKIAWEAFSSETNHCKMNRQLTLRSCSACDDNAYWRVRPETELKRLAIFLRFGILPFM